MTLLDSWAGSLPVSYMLGLNSAPLGQCMNFANEHNTLFQLNVAHQGHFSFSINETCLDSAIFKEAGTENFQGTIWFMSRLTDVRVC